MCNLRIKFILQCMFCLSIFYSVGVYALDTPVIVEPNDTAIIQGPQTIFRWQPLESGQWCQIQIARDATFTDLLADADNIYGTEWTYEPLPQDGNTYYWRIRAKQMQGQEGEGESEPSEGEGEPQIEGESAEGEFTEGEGEVLLEGEKEGEAPNEGELAFEGEAETIEGETAEGEEESGGKVDSCGCSAASSTKQLLGDWLMIGLALMMLVSLSGNMKR